MVPTHHPRHAITETEDIKAALVAAGRVWPQLVGKPNALLRRLIKAGQEALEGADDRRLRAIGETKGALAGVYGAGYLDDLRTDWPE